jgi:hypothetical protein
MNCFEPDAGSDPRGGMLIVTVATGRDPKSILTPVVMSASLYS